MVDLVRVDVQAVDSTGHPIPNLVTDDFEVFIDGRPRRVVSTELVRYSVSATVASDKVLAPIRTPGRIPEDGRLYVIAVDQSAFRTGALGQVRQALQQFINQLRVEDMVGLYDFPYRLPLLNLTHDHSEVIGAFNRLTGLMDPAMGVFGLSPSEIVDITAGDPDTLSRVVSRECDPADTHCPMAVKGEASAMAGYMEADAQMRLNALRNLMNGLSTIAGRKTVVLVSGGMLSSHARRRPAGCHDRDGSGGIGGGGRGRQPLRAALRQPVHGCVFGRQQVVTPAAGSLRVALR